LRSRNGQSYIRSINWDDAGGMCPQKRTVPYGVVWLQSNLGFVVSGNERIEAVRPAVRGMAKNSIPTPPGAGRPKTGDFTADRNNRDHVELLELETDLKRKMPDVT